MMFTAYKAQRAKNLEFKAFASLILLSAASVSIGQPRSPTGQPDVSTGSQPKASESNSVPVLSAISKSFSDSDNHNEVKVKDHRLTVRVKDQALLSVVDAIAQQSGMSIVTIADLSATRVSIQLHDVPIDQGLRTLLGEWDVFVFYAASQGTKLPSTHTAWIYPKGQGQELIPVSAKRGLAEHQARSRCEQKGPGPVPEHSVENENPEESLLHVLTDPNDEVRYRRLEKALNSGAYLPDEAWHELLKTDPSEQVRALALRALTEEAAREDIRSVAEEASADPSAAIRERAEESLRAIDELEQMHLESGQGDPAF